MTDSVTGPAARHSEAAHGLCPACRRSATADTAECGCNPAGPGPDNSWPDGPPFYSEDCPVHGRQPTLHDTNTCPDEDCAACIRGCLGCGRKYVRTVNGYCARCVDDEA